MTKEEKIKLFENSGFYEINNEYVLLINVKEEDEKYFYLKVNLCKNQVTSINDDKDFRAYQITENNSSSANFTNDINTYYIKDEAEKALYNFGNYCFEHDIREFFRKYASKEKEVLELPRLYFLMNYSIPIPGNQYHFITNVKQLMLNMAGQKAGTIELKDEIFGIEPNENAVHDVVKNYLANQRQGTQSAKTRGEVRGGGRKPFRQKGTGRHRQGSSTDPSQIGGGVVFAPKPRDYSYSVPKKVKRLAMLSALSAKVADGEMIVLDELKMEAPKTKEMVATLANIKAGKKPLIITAAKDENVVKSAANIPGVRTALVGTMNVYEIVNHDSFIVTKEAIEKIEEVYL
jgi:large subunit ribosomal protein L4